MFEPPSTEDVLKELGAHILELVVSLLLVLLLTFFNLFMKSLCELGIPPALRLCVPDIGEKPKSEKALAASLYNCVLYIRSLGLLH